VGTALALHQRHPQRWTDAGGGGAADHLSTNLRGWGEEGTTERMRSGQ
jgi:hypothetical protein